MTFASRKLIEIGAEHVGHPVGVTPDVRLAAWRLGEPLSDLAQRPLDQLPGEFACRLHGFWQRLPHEDRNHALARCARLLRLGCITIKRCGIAERTTDRSLVAFGAYEGVDQRAESLRWRLRTVSENAAQEPARAPPLVALQTKQDGRLVRKILVERANAHPGPLSHPRGGEALRALLCQDPNSGIQNGRHQLIGAGLLRLFS